MKKFYLLLFVLFAFLAFSTNFAFAGFPDVETDQQYFESIDYLKDIGVFLGDAETGNFRPYDNLNRAELATVTFRLTKADDLELVNKANCFPDVKYDWYANTVCWAKDMKYVQGYTGGDLAGKYGPAQLLNYAELIDIMARIYEWETEPIGDHWYVPAWSYADDRNILIKGINPEDEVVRGEMAEIIFRTIVLEELGLDVYEEGSYQDELPRGDEIDLDPPYSTDMNNAYYYGEVIYGADADTFEVIYSGKDYVFYAKDAEHVYIDDNIVQGADPETFEYLGNILGKDSENVYLGFSAVPDIDAASFEYLGGIYAKDASNVYTNTVSHGDGRTIDPLADADVESFVLVDGNFHFAKDNQYVWFNGELIEGADADSFEVISDYSPYIDALSKDENFIYSNSEILEGADVDSFRATEVEDTFVDDNNLYYHGSVYTGIDTSTVDFLYDPDGNFSAVIKDIYGVYILADELVPIETADPESFKIISIRYRIYAKDKDKVFINEKIIEGADSETFELLQAPADFGPSYSKDKNNVYWDSVLIEGADSSSFELIKQRTGIENYFGKDSNHLYKNGELIEYVDVATFEYYEIPDNTCGTNYSKDKQNIYDERLNIIESADYDTFKPGCFSKKYGYGDYAADKNYLYQNGNIFSENSFPLAELELTMIDANDNPILYGESFRLITFRNVSGTCVENGLAEEILYLVENKIKLADDSYVDLFTLLDFTDRILFHDYPLNEGLADCSILRDLDDNRVRVICEIDDIEICESTYAGYLSY